MGTGRVATAPVFYKTNNTDITKQKTQTCTKQTNNKDMQKTSNECMYQTNNTDTPIEKDE